MWLLPVSAGGLANGKWYTATRLRTKSFSLTRTHTKTHVHARTTTPDFHLRRLRHAYLEFTSACDSEPRGVFISFRRKYKWHKTLHKSNHRSLWRKCFIVKGVRTLPRDSLQFFLYGVKSKVWKSCKVEQNPSISKKGRKNRCGSMSENLICKYNVDSCDQEWSKYKQNMPKWLGISQKREWNSPSGSRSVPSICRTLGERPSSLSVPVTAQVTVIQMAGKHELSIYKLQLTAAGQSHGQLMFKHSRLPLRHQRVPEEGSLRTSLSPPCCFPHWLLSEARHPETVTRSDVNW